jgi:hypothetical protein
MNAVLANGLKRWTRLGEGASLNPRPSELEQRVARLERRIAYAEELLDESYHHQLELEAAIKRRAVSDATVAA